MFTSLSRSKTLTLAALCGASLLGACASGARPEMMTATADAVPPAAAADAAYKAVRVTSVEGGSETNPLWMSGVSTKDFRAALESSLKATNHLADAAGSARYNVTANLLNIDRPMMGLNLTTTTSVNYKVTGAADNAVVYEETIKAEGTAKMSDSLIAVERLRKANEASVRNSIQQFIQNFRQRLGAQQQAAVQ